MGFTTSKQKLHFNIISLKLGLFCPCSQLLYHLCTNLTWHNFLVFPVLPNWHPRHGPANLDSVIVWTWESLVCTMPISWYKANILNQSFPWSPPLKAAKHSTCCCHSHTTKGFVFSATSSFLWCQNTSHWTKCGGIYILLNNMLAWFFFPLK